MENFFLRILRVPHFSAVVVEICTIILSVIISDENDTNLALNMLGSVNALFRLV